MVAARHAYFLVSGVEAIRPFGPLRSHPRQTLQCLSDFATLGNPAATLVVMRACLEAVNTARVKSTRCCSTDYSAGHRADLDSCQCRWSPRLNPLRSRGHLRGCPRESRLSSIRSLLDKPSAEFHAELVRVASDLARETPIRFQLIDYAGQPPSGSYAIVEEFQGSGGPSFDRAGKWQSLDGLRHSDFRVDSI